MFWRFQIVGWTGFAILTLPLKITAFESVSYALLITLFREPFGVLLTWGFRSVCKGLERRNYGSTALLIAVLAMGPLAGGLDALYGLAVETFLLKGGTRYPLMPIFLFRCMIYYCWSFLYFWIHLEIAANRRELDLAHAETAARDAELLMLRAQVAPHFLFNALNTIMAGLQKHPAKLAPVVQGLADYLRYSLDNTGKDLVRLGEEHEAVMNYLEVEKGCFRDALVVESHIDPEAKDLLVPGVFLQPLVENALKYGHRTSPTPLRVSIRVEATPDNGVIAEVENSGTWVNPLPSRSPDNPGGHGLAILRRRLQLLCPDPDATGVFHRTTADSVIATIRIQTCERGNASNDPTHPDRPRG